MDFSGFWSGLVATIVGGAIVLFLGYLVIDRRLRLEDAAARRRDRETTQNANREAVLQSVHGELESNAAQLTTALREMPKGALLYPLFDVTMWALVSEPSIFTTLRRETIGALTHAYNRMSTSNEQNAFLSDLDHGSTSILVTASVAGTIGNARVRRAYDLFVERREEMREGLVGRLEDLKIFLDGAIDAVEAELGMTSEHPAASRVYEAETAATFAVRKIEGTENSDAAG